MTPEKFNRELFTFINNSPTPFHAVAVMEENLREKGFISLDEKNTWNLDSNGRYYITRNGSALIAFVMGEKPPLGKWAENDRCPHRQSLFKG